jgi:hypothetical protein
MILHIEQKMLRRSINIPHHFLIHHKAPNLTLQGYLTGQLGRHWYPPMYPLDETNISYSHLKNRMAQMQYQSIFFGGIGRGVLFDLVRSRPRGAEGTPPLFIHHYSKRLLSNNVSNTTQSQSSAFETPTLQFNQSELTSRTNL